MARLLMVVSSLAPLFLLWALRGAPPVPDICWVSICLALVVLPNLALSWRWHMASRRNDHRIIVIAASRDNSEHLLVYLFALLLPLYTAELQSERELAAVVVAFVFIVFLFWHMNLHYMNIIFAILGYRVYTVEMASGAAVTANSVVLLSKRISPPPTGGSVDAFRLSDTVYIEKGGG